MIYFESFKLENNPYKNYGLTWEINKENIVIVTTDNNEYTKSLFNFLKNREKYEHGRCFIDDIDITNLSSENYNNFKFNNFIFLDNDLIINPKWNFRKISKIYKSLINPNIHLNNLFNIPFSKLNVIDKLKIWFSLVHNNKQKYIFINLLDNKFNNNEIKQIYDLCSNQATSLGKQIIVFINNEVNDSNIVININKKYFYNNQTLTISKEEYHFNKYSIIDKKIFFKIFFRLTIWEFILFSLSGLILGIICFFIFSVQFIINDVNNPISLLEFISKNRILWNFLGVLIYILLVLNIFLCFW
ncbi:MAG: hypothetical protein K2N40_01220, partial [Ureaplasma sp.]|nr:hypothetical protein [Ureaplasma sp.]